MEYKLIHNRKIPVLGVGTWGVGGKSEKDASNKEESIKAIRSAIELGLTHIDTSEYYGAGFTEEIIGEAIKPYDRKGLFITSKVWMPTSYSNVMKAFESSLKRLGTDYLDLYLIHRPNDGMDLRASMKAFEELNKRGVARAIGLSNFSVERILEARKYLSRSRISAIQNEYNFIKKDEETLQFCQKENVIFIAYRPLMAGRLKQSVPLLDELSKKYNKTYAQISLNWLISKDKVVTIPRASKLEHLEEISDSMGWKMNIEDYKKLDELKVNIL